MTPWTMLGIAAGVLTAPFFAVGSAFRRARIFHPAGVVVRADVQALAEDGPIGVLAHRLAGPALVRLSGAAWRSDRLPDVLGCAIRFRRTDSLDPAPGGDDQDLILATIKSLWDIPTGVARTDAWDFLGNTFWSGGGYEIDGVRGRLRLRLVPLAPSPLEGSERVTRLDEAMRRDHAVLRLEVKRVADDHGWEPVIALRLRERVVVDQELLRFSPFRAGRGLRPRGFFQGLRLAAYPASQAARQTSTGRAPAASPIEPVVVVDREDRAPL
jgi:hypothetical protein